LRRQPLRAFFAALVLVAVLGAAVAVVFFRSPEAPLPGLRPVPFSALPGWGEDRAAEALPPLLATCARLAVLPPGYALGGTVEADRLGGTPAAWAPACAEAATLPPGDEAAARAFLERRFTPHAAGTGLLTGYYEPELRGAPRPGGAFAMPLLGRPPELVEVDLGAFAPDLRGRRIAGQIRDGRLQPFPDRAAIEAGALDGRGLELVWVDSAVDAFFLQIQGSGRVVLPDGRVMRLGYAGQNGHPYVPVGRLLVERGEMAREQVSAPAIRAWLADAGAERAAELMRQNPSYVFFRPRPELAPEVGPIGTLGVPLTPGRSLAVDRRAIPLGAPVWIAARHPVEGMPLRRLVIAQDTGGAITGPARGDLFWGWGEAAAEAAGRMREQAEIFVLLPREAVAAAAAPPSP
jgi:membrane-bound lytic murein transglycosylase A